MLRTVEAWPSAPMSQRKRKGRPLTRAVRGPDPARRPTGRELDAAVPEDAGAGLFRAGSEQRMQVGAADADAGAAGKVRINAMGGVLEADAAKGVAVGCGEGDAEPGEGLAGIGHEAFAAGFVDGGGACLDDGATDPTLAERDGGGESGGATADDQGFAGRGGRGGLVKHRGGHNLSVLE